MSGRRNRGRRRGCRQAARAVAERSRAAEGAAAAKDAGPLLRSLTAPSSWPNAPPAVGEGHYEFLPFEVPFRMVMGTAPLDPDDWIQVDAFYEDDMAVRRHILSTRRSAVVASLEEPGVSEAKAELLQLLLEYLPRRYPAIFQLEGHILLNKLTGEEFNISCWQHDPLELAARLVQEDLCIMMPALDSPDSEYRFVAGAVLFPNGWDLREKLGRTTSAIHGPVPLYHDKISRRVDAFMRLLTVEKPFWRANWTITDDPTLYRPLGEGDYASKMDSSAAEAAAAPSPVSGVPLSEVGSRLFTRSGRETFVRFPSTRAILFTVRTFVKPLGVFEGRPELAAECVRALDGLPDEVVKYKMLGPVRDTARSYLVHCAQGLVE